MKLVSYQSETHRVGLWHEGKVFDMARTARSIGLELPSTMLELLQMEEHGMQAARRVFQYIINEKAAIPLEEFQLLAPLPNPPSCRDAYSFRQHVATARQNRGLEMIPEFDQFPVFYFTNHRAIFGPGNIPLEKDHFQCLDFELEVAAIIGKHGKNISAKDADSYIAGFTIMNDLSARQLQMEEMKLNLGPAKGKDFATVLGPWLVTPEELEVSCIRSPLGSKFDLPMEAFHNGTRVSLGNMKDMTWSFAEIIERASYGAELYPGDVIGSGTVGTGCFLELNGTWALEAKERGKDHNPIWLQDADHIELRIDGLGALSNRVFLLPHSPSILARKKNQSKGDN